MSDVPSGRTPIAALPLRAPRSPGPAPLLAALPFYARSKPVRYPFPLPGELARRD